MFFVHHICHCQTDPDQIEIDQTIPPGQWSNMVCKLNTTYANQMEMHEMTSMQFEEMLQKAVEAAISKQKESTSNVLLKREATAARLGVDLSTLWRWDRSGYLRPVRIGRSVYYKLSDIEARERGEVPIYK